MTRACLAALLLLAACSSDAPETLPKAPPLALGSLAPAYSARTIGGDSVSFGGTSPALTLVNVWATWCTSCREEFTDLERFRNEHEAAGLRIVAVSVDQGGEEKVRKFAAAPGGRCPVVHEHEARISRLYGVVGLPSTYLIGRDGRVRWVLTGSFLEKRAEFDSVIRAELAHK